MNKLLFILFLCGVSIGSKADGDILSQNFSSGFENIGPNWLVHEREGWTVSGCEWFKPESNHALFPYSLVFKYFENGKSAYITSPKFGEKATNNVIVAFSYARYSINSNLGISSFSVKVNGGGIFESGTDIANYDITTEQGVFNNTTLKIFGASPATTITFQLTSPEIHFALNNVNVTSVQNMPLDESANNSSVIVERIADVSLKRTLTEGIWNTLCLPFDVDETILKQALGDEQDIQLRIYSSYNDGAMIFKDTEHIDAGTPFLIKLSETKNNPTFECVEVKDIEAQAITHNDVSFVGVYSPCDLPANGDNVSMFLSIDGRLLKPSGDNRTLKGLHAYFVAPAPVAARLILDGVDVTSIVNVSQTTMTDDNVWYAPSGIRYTKLPTLKGFYIKNGKKIIIK